MSKIFFTFLIATFKKIAKIIDFICFLFTKISLHRTRILNHLMAVVLRRRFFEEVQFSRFVSLLHTNLLKLELLQVTFE